MFSVLCPPVSLLWHDMVVPIQLRCMMRSLFAVSEFPKAVPKTRVHGFFSPGCFHTAMTPEFPAPDGVWQNTAFQNQGGLT